MAAHTPVWMKIPVQQCPCTHRAEDLHCSARNEGKERYHKAAICLADPTGKVALLSSIWSPFYKLEAGQDSVTFF